MTKALSITGAIVLVGILLAVSVAFSHNVSAQSMTGGNQGSETSGCSYGSCANIYNGAIAQLCFSDGCVNVFGAWGTFEQQSAASSTVRSARQFMSAYASWFQVWAQQVGHPGAYAALQTDPNTGMITQVSCSNGVLYAATYNINCPDGSPAPGEDPTQCSCAQGNIYACSNSCPDGSAAPGGDPTQCSCAQGNMTICAGSCPDGSTAPYGDPSRCSCAQGNVNACTNDYCPDGSPAPGDNPSQCTCAHGNTNACTGGSCPVGQFAENGQCVSSCDTGYVREGNECVFGSCPAGYTAGTDSNGDPICTFNSCPIGYVQQSGECVFQGCPIGYAQQGTQCVFQGCPQDYTQLNGLCVQSQVAAPSGDITALPLLLKTGKTSEVSWNAASVASCTVSGTNGDSWSCTGAACNATTTETTMPIENQTTYTLSCTGLDNSAMQRSVTINVAPNFCETGAPGCE
jgi:hypothetical protein